MAEESEQPKESTAGKGFQMKLGPLKVWQWGVIVIGAVAGIVIVKRLMGGGTPVAAVGTGAGTTGIADTGTTSSAPAASSQDFAAAIQNLSDSVTKQFAAQAAATQAVASQEQQDVQTLGNLATTNATQTAALGNTVSVLQGTTQSRFENTALALDKLAGGLQSGTSGEAAAGQSAVPNINAVNPG